MKTSLVLAFLGVTILANHTGAQTTKMLSPLTSFGNANDGSVQPPVYDVQYPPMDTGNNQRGMTRDPVTGHLVLVNTASGGGGSGDVRGAIHIIDGTYGTNLSTLDTNGIYGGNYADASAGVADDGVVYIANLVNTSTNLAVTIYRWNNVWQSNVPPSIAFSNTIAPVQRYGTSLDVRGSGPNTQILMGSMAYSAGESGTNVVLFTTTDGAHFTANILGADVTSANFNDGLAFGSGNTFWAKRIGAPLRLMSFDPGTLTATTLLSYDATQLPGTANLGPLAVDTAHNLLAAIEVASGTTGSEKVWLFDISNTNRAPVLLDIQSFAPNNANASAPPGYLDFGGGHLYAHVINNGLLVYKASTVATPFPTILVQPAATNRIVAGQSVTLSALAYPDVTYQWQKNTRDIPGATNVAHTISNAQTNDSGVYRVVVSNGGGSLNSSDSQLTVVNPAELYHLKLLWSAVAGEANYFITASSAGTVNQRTMAYNALSNELYIVARRNTTSQDFVIYTVNATNLSVTPPAVIKTLNTNGIILPAAGIGLVGIGVAEDGAIYACNMTADASGGGGAPFRLYRWANSDPATTPVEIFTGDPTGFSGIRWGDYLDVRGGGTSTQIILDNYNNPSTAPSQRYIAVLRPTDATLMNPWSSSYYFPDTYGGTRIGRTLAWGAGDTCWQLRSGSVTATPYQGLIQSSLDLGSTGAIAPGAVKGANFDPELVLVGMDFSRHLLVGIHNISPSHLIELYEVSNLSTPLLVAQYAFPIAAKTNDNRIGQVIFTGDYVFALYSQNGVLAFQLRPGPPTAPEFLTHPQNLRLVEAGSGTLSAQTDQISQYQWRKNGTNITGATGPGHTISNAQLNDAGDYRVIATNAYGAATSAVAVVTVTSTNDVYRLAQVWSASPYGGPVYVTSTGGGNTPNERAIGFNTLSSQLLVVQRDGVSGGTTYSVQVVDGNSGAWLHKLRTDVTIVNEVVSEVSGQNGVGLVAIGAADDGAVYACNLSPNAAGGANSHDPAKLFRVYRWASSDRNTVPTEIFTGDPAGQTANYRWGDTLRVRGGGLNTEILLDAKDGGFAAILKPTDSSMTTFTNFWWPTSVGDGTIGRSLQYGNGASHWQKRKGGGLMSSTFNPNANTSVLVTNYSNFPATLGGVEQDLARNIAVGVDYIGVLNTSPDAVGMYEISNPMLPMLVARYNFPANFSANNNFIGNSIIAGNRVFSLDGNNGIVAFEIIAPATPPTLEIAVPASGVVISWTTNATGFTLQTSPVVNPPSWTNVGAGTIVADKYQVTEPAPAVSKFYRLKK